MANTKQAKKRAEQNDRQRLRNRAVRTRTRKDVKAVRVATEADPAQGKAKLPATQSTLDVAVRKGVLHRRTAARLKSRVAKAVNKATAKAAPKV